MKEIYAYIRISNTSKKAAAESDSSNRQLKAIRSFCRKKKFKIKGIYEDVGVSGDSGFDLSARESYSEMIEDMKREGLNAFVVSDYSRYSRSVVTAAVLSKNLRDEGIQCFDAGTGLDLASVNMDNPEVKLISNILLCISEFEKMNVVNRLQGARRQKKKNGGYIGGTKKLGTNENDRRVLDRIKEMKRLKLNQSEIADTLNKEGFTNRRGGPFSQVTVSNYCQHLKKSKG